MDNLADPKDGLSIENRLDHGTLYAHKKLRWLRPLIYIVYFALLPALFSLLNHRVQHQTLLFVGTFGLVLCLALILKLLTDQRNRLIDPTKAQRAAINKALQERDYDHAVQLANEMLLRVAGPVARDISANAYLRAGKFHEAHILSLNAIEGYNRLLESTSKKETKSACQQNLSRAQTLLGAILVAQERFVEGELVFVEAMQMNPDNSWAMINYVEALLYQRKSLDLALDTIQKVETVRAKNGEAVQPTPAYMRAWAHALKGERPAAEKWLSEALELAATTNNAAVISEVHYAEGLIYQVLGDDDEARRAFEQSIAVDPKGFNGLLAARALEALS